MWKIPETLYHGTFIPVGKELDPSDQLVIPNDYVSTTEILDWAWYFARAKRFRYAHKAGILTIYTIDTRKLPLEILEGCIPPWKYDPRAKIHKSIKAMEQELRADRRRIKEWRLPYIPLDATTSLHGFVDVESEFLSSYYALMSYGRISTVA